MAPTHVLSSHDFQASYKVSLQRVWVIPASHLV